MCWPLFSVDKSQDTRKQSQVAPGMFSLDIRKNLFVERLVKNGRLPKEMMEVFKKRVTVALRGIASGWT